jgi:hypothetical protein
MQHLMPETLARLVDEAPGDDETRHLAECGACRAELEGMRADAAALANLPMIEPPPTEWPELEARLLDEGLIRRHAGAPRWAALGRAAAAVALFALGTATGTFLLRGSAPVAERGAVLANTLGTGVPVRNGQEPMLVRAAEPANADEALLLYRQAEAVYLDALTRVAELGGQAESGDPLARLAALESIAAITRSALDESPADPVINGYHLTALAQREATLRQIAATKSDRWF